MIGLDALHHITYHHRMQAINPPIVAIGFPLVPLFPLENGLRVLF